MRLSCLRCKAKKLFCERKACIAWASVAPWIGSVGTKIRRDHIVTHSLLTNLQSLGLHNISLFVQCLRNGHEELQQKGLMVISVAKSG